MSDGFLPFSRKEVATLDTPAGMARVLWRRYYRDMRLWWRGETARMEHEIMWGTGDPSTEPRGILNCAGVERPANDDAEDDGA